MSNLNINPKRWLQELFSYNYCEECGGDVQHHLAIPFHGNWFAKCNYPRNETTGELHPVIQKFRLKQEKTNV